MGAFWDPFLAALRSSEPIAMSRGLRLAVGACALCMLVTIGSLPANAANPLLEELRGYCEAPNTSKDLKGVLADDEKPYAWTIGTTKARFPTGFLPDGGTTPLFLLRGIPATELPSWRFYAFGRTGDDEASRTVEDISIFGQRAGTSAEKKAFGGETTVLTIQVPRADDYWWPKYQFIAIGCPPATNTDAQPIIARLNADLSSRTTAIWGTIIVVVLVYLTVSLTVSRVRGVKEWVNVVQWAAGSMGKASLSNLQVIWFSTIVFALTLFFALRLGGLSELSVDILSLMGISLLGAGSTKFVARKRQTLSTENRTWLTKRGWPKPKSHVDVTGARFGELFAEDEGFDPAKYQAVIFSLVVGAALLVTGFQELSTFTVPQAFLALLGGSQAAYVIGKNAAYSNIGELDKLLDDVRDKQDKFQAEATKKKIDLDDMTAMQKIEDEPTVKQTYLELEEALDLAAKLAEKIFNESIPIKIRKPHVGP